MALPAQSSSNYILFLEIHLFTLINSFFFYSVNGTFLGLIFDTYKQFGRKYNKINNIIQCYVNVFSYFLYPVNLSDFLMYPVDHNQHHTKTASPILNPGPTDR